MSVSMNTQVTGMITLIIVKNPFAPQDGRVIKKIEYTGTVRRLKELNAVEGVKFRASVNGYSTGDEAEVKKDDFIVLYPAVEKGGKGGKGILSIVAAIALSVVSFGIASGGWLAGLGKAAFAAGHWGAYAAAAAVMFLGSSLVGRLMGQKADTGSYEGENSEATYSWGEVQTMEGQNNPVSLTYGTVKSGGQTIGKYIKTDDNDEIMNWLVAAGEGELRFSNIKLNDNDYDDYDDVSVTTRSGTNDQDIISEFGDTYATKNLNYKLDGSWASDTAQGTDTRGLVFTIEFPNGLYHVTDSGKLENAWVTLDIEYKISGGSWTNLFKEVSSNSYGITLRKNVGAGTYSYKIAGNIHEVDTENSSYTYFSGCSVKIGSDTATISKKDINNGRTVTVGSFSVNTSKWSDTVKDKIFDGGSYNGTLTVSAGSGMGTITAKTRSAVRKQFRVNHITSGEYEVRAKVRGRQYSESNNQASTTCYWTAVTSVIYDNFIYPCTALIGISAKATDQLSGSPSLTFLKTRSRVWVWDGSSYVQKNANNPAWACYDLLHQARQLTNINTGKTEMEVRGVPADRMRYADFNRWASWCSSMKLYVNIEINASGEMLDVCNQKIAPIGRGMVVRFGTRYGCIYDHVQTPVQMFGMGNIIAGTFSEEFLKVEDRANCVEVTFTNKDADYQRDILTVYGDSFDTDGYAKTAQLTMDGITSYTQAYREGKYQLMCNKYQLRTISFEADIDAIACTVGDVILVSHDVPKWANSGRIDSVISENTLRLPIYVNDLTKQYRLQFRSGKDVLYTCPCDILETSEDGWTTVFLDDPDYPEDDSPQAGDVFDLAIANIGSKPFVIKSITRSQDFRRRLTCIEYAEALFDESYDIPPIQYSVNENKKANNVTKLSAVQYQYTDENRVRHGIMSVSWKRPSNGGKFTVLISTDNKKWITAVSETVDNSVEFEVKARTSYYVKVITIQGLRQSTGVRVGLISPGQDKVPAKVTGINCKVHSTDRTKAELTWDENTDIDFRYFKVTVQGGKTYTTASNVLTITSNQNTPTVTIIAVDNAGNKSEAVSLVVPIYTYPSNVAGFTVTQQATDRSVLEFTWNAVSDSDLSQYELRVGNTWASGTQFARTKTRKTTYQVSENGTYIFWISAQNAAENYSQNPVKIQKQINIVPDPVTALTVTQDTKDSSKAVIQFIVPYGEDIAKYVIKYGADWDNGNVIAETKDARFEWQVPASGTYEVMVKAVTVAGQESAVTTASITIMVEPLDVTNFRAVQNTAQKTLVTLSWDAAEQPDVVYYIIKKGTTWNDAEAIAPRVSSTTYDVTIDTELPYTWMIKAVTFAGNESLYPAVLENQIFGLVPSKVEEIQLRQNPNDRSQLIIQWMPVSDGDLTGYQVKIGDKWDSAEDLPLTNEVYATYALSASGNYKVMIKALNSAGYYSDEASASLRCKVEPTNATNFIAYQNGEEVELYWTKSVDTDVVGYEIREGSSFDTGTLITTGVTNNYFETKVSIERYYRYHIAAINRAGFISDTAVNTQVLVENLPIKNFILSIDEIASPTGTHDNTEIGESLINFQTAGGKFYDYNTIRWTDLGGSNVLKLKKIYKTQATEKSCYSESIPASATGQIEYVKLRTIGGNTVLLDENLVSAAVTQIKSMDSNKKLLATLTIPSEVQALDGYGWSSGSACNYIDFEQKVFVKNVGRVDLGSLSWSNNNGWFYTTMSVFGAKLVLSDSDYSNFVCELYTNVPFTVLQNKETDMLMSSRTNGYAQFYNTSYTTNAEFKAAMSGVYLYYELTIPVETDISAYLVEDTIEVETGGTLTFENSSQLSIPLKYDYCIDSLTYYEKGTYTLQQIDVGQIITAEISCYFVSSVMHANGSVSAILKFRTSLDGETWIDWMDFKPLQRRFRYIEFKVMLATNDTNKTPEVNHFVISIDVPDTDIAITHVIETGGTMVPYGHEFYAVPNVTATAIGETLHAVVNSRNRTGCVVNVYDSNNNDVGGTVDIKIKGY